MREITWQGIYADFQSRHPNLSATAVRHCPYGFATILIYLNDGAKMIYNYDSKRTRFLARR